MAIAETERSELVQALTDAIGERPAGNLMSSIFPEGKDHLASKADVKALEVKTEAGFARVDGEFAKVDGRFDKIDGKFAEVNGKFERLRGHFELMLAKQARTMLLAMMAFMVTTWAGMLAGFLTLASMING